MTPTSNFKEGPYIRELKKFWRKKLAPIKKPRIRKRKMITYYVFVTIAAHRRNGLPTKDKHTQ